MAGTTVLHYDLIEQIGGGGMGVVWKARDTLLDRLVALKFLRVFPGANPAGYERFLREARAASALNHPNIVTIHEINVSGEEPFIVMELVRGQSLAALLQKVGRLPPGLATDYATQLCEGLGAAHRAGIIHRDIKPSNLILTGEGVIKILDFGLAKSRGSEPAEAVHGSPEPLSAAGEVRGTVPYMSPEQAAGDPVGPPSDVFAVGVVLYEMLSGRRPFDGSTNTEIMRAVLSSDPPALLSLAPDLPVPLVEIVQTCLAKRPDARFSDAGELAWRLRALDRAGWPQSASEASTVVMKAARPRSVRRARLWQWVAALTVLTAVLGLMAVVVQRGSRQQSNPILQATAAKSRTEGLLRAQELLKRYDRKGNVESAIALLEPIARGGSATAAIHAALAEACVQGFIESPKKRELLDRALASGRRAVELTPDLAAAHVALGRALASAGDKVGAEAAFLRARDLNPLNAHAYLGLADLTRGHEAETLHRKAIEVSPQDWIPWNRLGVFHYRDGNYTAAIQAWKKAMDLAPDNLLVIRNTGVGHHMQGEYEAAADYVQKALSLDDTAGPTWANLGTARYFQGKYADAARAMERAVHLSPDRFLFWGNLGDCLRHAGGAASRTSEAYRKALALLDQELKRTPNDAGMQASRAMYLAKSGDHQGALAAIPYVEQGAKADPTVMFRLALVHELGGSRAKAMTALEAAITGGYSMHEISREPDLRALRTHPRYLMIAARGAAEPKR